LGAGWFAASSVALLEQPETVRNAAAATARKSLRGPLEFIISHLQSVIEIVGGGEVGT
jgi:hypothetical protein